MLLNVAGIQVFHAYTWIKKTPMLLSLVSKPHDFIQPDLNGDGARDLDPIGNLGRSLGWLI